MFSVPDAVGIIAGKNPIASAHRIFTTWRYLTSHNPLNWPAWSFITVTDKLRTRLWEGPSAKIIFQGLCSDSRFLGFQVPGSPLLDPQPGSVRPIWGSSSCSLLDLRRPLSFAFSLPWKRPKYFPALASGIQGIPRWGAWDSDKREDGGEVRSWNMLTQAAHCSWRTLSAFIAGDVSSTVERDLQQLPALWLHLRISLLCEFSFILQIFVMQLRIATHTPCAPLSLLPQLCHPGSSKEWKVANTRV